MSHSMRIKEKRKVVAELESRIKLCEQYKQQVTAYLLDLNKKKQNRAIGTAEYLKILDKTFSGKNPIDWIDYYNHEIRKTRERIYDINSEIKESINIVRSRNIKILAATLIVIIMLSLGAFIFKPDITGFVIGTGQKEIVANYTDGYDVEGTKWADIKGERLYERCMKVRSGIEFDAVTLNAKVTSASDGRSLALSIYNHPIDDEPDTELGSCIVEDYSGIWKSCSIDNLNGGQEIYWLCAYSDSGDADSTQYTLAYSTGGSRKTALWTGSYWQKLERSSYTMNADFIRWK